MPDEPHQPAGCDDRSEEKNPAIESVADHRASCGSLRDAEDHGSESCKEQHGSEVGRREHLNLPPDAEIVRVYSGDEVEQTRDDYKFGAVVGGDQLYGTLPQRKEPGDNVEQTSTEVTREAKHIQRVARIGYVNFGLHGEAEREHCGDRDKQQESTNPMTGEQVPGAGNEPAEDQRRVNKALSLRLCRSLRLRCHAS